MENNLPMFPLNAPVVIRVKARTICVGLVKLNHTLSPICKTPPSFPSEYNIGTEARLRLANKAICIPGGWSAGVLFNAHQSLLTSSYRSQACSTSECPRMRLTSPVSFSGHSCEISSHSGGCSSNASRVPSLPVSTSRPSTRDKDIRYT